VLVSTVLIFIFSFFSLLQCMEWENAKSALNFAPFVFRFLFASCSSCLSLFSMEACVETWRDRSVCKNILLRIQREFAEIPQQLSFHFLTDLVFVLYASLRKCDTCELVWRNVNSRSFVPCLCTSLRGACNF
jgi:hypothetical protein